MLLDVVTIWYGGPVLERLGEALAHSAGRAVVQVHMHSLPCNILLELSYFAFLKFIPSILTICHSADRFIKLSGRHRTQTQISEVR